MSGSTATWAAVSSLASTGADRRSRMVAAPSSEEALASRRRRCGSSDTGMTATASRARATSPFSGRSPVVTATLTSRCCGVLRMGSDTKPIFFEG